MVPWWEGFNSQSDKRLGRRHPGVYQVWLYIRVLPLVLIAEFGLSLAYTEVLRQEGRGVLRLIFTIFLWIFFVASLFRMLVSGNLLIMGILVHQTIILFLTAVSLVAEAVNASKNDVLFCLALALTVVTLMGIFWAVYIYQVPGEGFNDGSTEMPRIIPSTNEYPGRDEDGPLARHYNNLNLQGRPDISLGQHELNASVTANGPNTAIPSPRSARPWPANGGANSPAPRATLPATISAPKLALETKISPTASFRCTFAMITVGLVLEGLAMWGVVETVLAGWPLHGITVTLLILPLCTVPLTVSFRKVCRNPSSENRKWNAISTAVCLACLFLGLILSFAAAVEPLCPRWSKKECTGAGLWISHLFYCILSLVMCFFVTPALWSFAGVCLSDGKQTSHKDGILVHIFKGSRPTRI